MVSSPEHRCWHVQILVSVVAFAGRAESAAPTVLGVLLVAFCEGLTAGAGDVRFRSAYTNLTAIERAIQSLPYVLHRPLCTSVRSV